MLKLSVTFRLCLYFALAIFSLPAIHTECYAFIPIQLVTGFAGMHGSKVNTYSGHQQENSTKRASQRIIVNRKNSVIRTEVILPDWNHILDAKYENYEPGSIVFNPPNTMNLTNWYVIESVISSKRLNDGIRAELESLLKEPKFAQYTSLSRVGEYMELHLYAKEESAFKITPETKEEQAIIGGSAHWLWRVQPLEMGSKTLYLRASVIIKDHTQKEVGTKKIVVLEKPIEVEIISDDIFSIILDYVNNHETIAVGAFTSFAAILVGIWKLCRRKP